MPNLFLKTFNDLTGLDRAWWFCHHVNHLYISSTPTGAIVQKAVKDPMKKMRECGRLVREELMNLENFFSTWPAPADEIKNENVRTHTIAVTRVLI